MNATTMIETPVRCIACNSPVTVTIRGLVDNRLGVSGAYQVGICPACSLEQLCPMPRPEELGGLYERFYNFGGESSTAYTRWRESFFRTFLARVWCWLDGDISFYLRRGKGRLLDVGCNEGRGLSFYRQSGFQPEGLEINDKAAAKARSLGFSVHGGTIERFTANEVFDVVVLSNTLEHSVSPVAMLKAVSRVLRPGGEVWVSCPNRDSWIRKLFGRRWINWHVPFHTVHFSVHTLRSTLAAAGFEVLQAKQRTPALWLAHTLLATFTSTPGTPTQSLRRPVLVASLMLGLRSLLFPFLWLGNHTGNGDCLMLIARKRDSNCAF